MSQRAVTFNDFTRGEYGDLGPTLPQAAGPGWFAGNNVIKYRNGSVGPRPGLKAVTRTGADWPNGKIRVLYPSTNATQRTLAQIGNRGRQLRTVLADLEINVIDTFANNTLPEPTTWPNVGQHRADGNWVMVPDDGIYKADIDGSVITEVEPDLKGRAFKFYRDRQLASHGDDTYYSEPGITGWDDFTNWFGGTSFNPVTGFYEFRNGIVIPQETPNIDMVSGTIGTSSVLRRISTRTAPTDPYGAASIGSEFLVIMGRGMAHPMLYNGATWEELRHLRYVGPIGARTSLTNGSVPSHNVVDLEYDDSWMVMSGIVAEGATNRMLLAWDGARTFHTWETDIAPFARRFNQAVMLLTDGGSAGAPPEFYAWFPDLDRPAFTSDPYSQPGDATTTPLDAHFHLPANLVEEGHEQLVKGLVIEFTKWDTGAAATNHFDVTVSARRRYAALAPVTSVVQTFDEPGASATTDGVDVAWHLGFGDQGYGTEWQVKIDELRGCAIRSVTAIVEERAERI